MTSPTQRRELAKTYAVSSFARYQDNPSGFVTEVLQERLWGKLHDVLAAVRDHPQVAVTGANAVGKGWLAARIALWWLNAFHPAKVITTAAPPARQIRELLWAELRGSQKEALRRGIPLCGGEPQTMAIRTGDPNHWAQGFVIPMSGSREERVSKFQGHHSPNLLFIGDEAFGIPDEVFDAMDSCLSGEHNHILLLSNALARAGQFYRNTRSSQWKTIHISAFDHPNVIQNREIIPGAVTRGKTITRILSGSRALYDDEDPAELHEDAIFTVPDYFADANRTSTTPPPTDATPTEPTNGSSGPIEPIELRAIDQIGRDLAGTIRVVKTAGLSTKVLGRFPLQGDDSLINVLWLEDAKQRMRIYLEEHNGKPPEVEPKHRLFGLDLSEFGNDASVLWDRRDFFAMFLKEWSGVDPIAGGDIAMALIGNDPIVKQQVRIHVDGTGIGAGTGPYMKRAGYKRAISVKMGATPTRSLKQVSHYKDPSLLPAEEFKRMRSQAYWALREWLRTNSEAMIPDIEELDEDLTVLTYEVKPDHRLQVLPKADVRKLLGRSPNYGDGLALTFAQGGHQWRRIPFLKM